MSKCFEVKWEVDDGYCGASAPQSFYIDASDLDDDMSESEIVSLFEETLQDEFLQTAHPVAENQDKFVEWAKRIIAQRKEPEADNA